MFNGLDLVLLAILIVTVIYYKTQISICRQTIKFWRKTALMLEKQHKALK